MREGSQKSIFKLFDQVRRTTAAREFADKICFLALFELVAFLLDRLKMNWGIK